VLSKHLQIQYSNYTVDKCLFRAKAQAGMQVCKLPMSVRWYDFARPRCSPGG
jgi:hypothetical protein